jgi:hypothetical protein
MDSSASQGRAAGAKQQDPHHDTQLLRDMRMINEHTIREHGPLPRGGMPEQVKRKPNLPKPAPLAPSALAVEDIPTDPAGAEMFILGKLFKKRSPREAWPLRFDSFSFDAMCHHTLRCAVIFSRQHQLPERADIEPSGEPFSPDWKQRWTAGFHVSPEDVFRSPVEVRWTAMDGVARTVVIDLEKIFPERLILHNAKQEDVKDGWGLSNHSRRVEILLEVDDRTINIYMRGWVLLKERRDPENPASDSLRDLMLAWTKTY